MTRRVRHLFTRVTVAAVLAVGPVVVLSPPAYAQAPGRVGWWNTLSAGGTAAPAPTTPSGGMHVAAAPGQVLAYGAVLYPLPAHAVLGQLTFTIAGSQGTVSLVACPTKSTKWSGGDDQSADSAPAYDCGTTKLPGTVASDGKTVTFTLTSLPTGVLSLAIVPVTDQPFSADFDKPGASSLAVTTAPAAPQSAAPPPPATTQAPPPPTAHHSVSTAGRPLAVPNVPSSTTTQPVTSGGAAPQVASSAPPAPIASEPVAGSTHSAGSIAGRVIGLLALIAALMFWGLGRGLFGGRIMPLSMPTRSSQP